MPPVINRPMSRSEWGLLVFLGLLWGGSYFYVGVAVKELPPVTIVAFRVIVGALLLYFVVRLSGARMPRDRRSWMAFFVMGTMNNVLPFCLIAWAQGRIPSGFAAILNATTPLFAVLVAHFFTHDEKMTPSRIAGLIIGFLGVVVMIGPDALGAAGGDVAAELAALAASVLYAFSGVYGRRFARMGQSPMVTATGQITAAAIVMAPLSCIVDRPWTLPVPSLGVWAALLGLAAISTTLAYTIFYRILATAGAVNLLLVTFLVPVSALFLGIVFLRETINPDQILGIAAIGLGLAAIDGRPVRLLLLRRPA